MDNNTLKKMLRNVEKPARYTGGEHNSIDKTKDEYSIHYAFCFPDVYEVGMSHLGTRIIYDVLNTRNDCFCERCFTPWEDMEKELIDNNEVLFTLESKTPLNEFDFVGFTLQYEMSYTNIISMMKLGNIPLYSNERSEDDPIIVAGGPCVFNVEPIANFLDIVVLGEGEEINNLILDIYKRMKAHGKTKKEILIELSKHKGIYIPCLYDVKYKDGQFLEVIPQNGAATTNYKVVVSDMNTAHWPKNQILPYLSLVHDRVTLEIFRGCTRGCRFCQAGMIYRPVREKSVETLLSQARDNMKATGYEEISLSSLSSGDYSHLKELVLGLVDDNKGCNTSISLPSLRIDAHAKEYMQALKSERKSGLTLAPEAGSQRMRDVINKGVTQQDLINSVKDAYENGYDSIKLYFMLGLPTETYEDIDAIYELCKLVSDEYFVLPKEKRRKRLRITVSTSCFIPKSYTPFQWVAQDSQELLMEKQRYLKTLLKTVKSVSYNYHDADVSMLEAVFARGDRRLDKVIVRAHELGCKFDGWTEYFNYSKWIQAFQECNIDPIGYTKEIDIDAPLPWSHTSPGVSIDFLKREWKLALQEKTTIDCRHGCLLCDASDMHDCVSCNPCRKNTEMFMED